MRYVVDNTSIQSVLDEVLPGSEIFIKNGIYREKIVIRQNNIKLIGESKEGVIITNNDYYLKVMADHNECNTFRTYTLQVVGDNVSLANLTIENSAVPSSKYGQAVALHTCGNSFLAENIVLKGAQDTLFTAPLPDDLKERYVGFLPEESRDTKASFQKFIHCDIYGDVDFIFGGATVLFKECQIHCIGRSGYIAAPSHKKETEYGYLFLNCNILDETIKPIIYYYLARPWRDYGSVAFINCTSNLEFNDERFDKWNQTNRHLTCRFYEDIKSEKMAGFAHFLDAEAKQDYVESFMEYLERGWNN